MPKKDFHDMFITNQLAFVYFRGIQHQTVQELERQVELLRDRDGQLQYTVKEQEAKIEALKQKLKNTGDKVSYHDIY